MSAEEESNDNFAKSSAKKLRKRPVRNAKIVQNLKKMLWKNNPNFNAMVKILRQASSRAPITGRIMKPKIVKTKPRKTIQLVKPQENKAVDSVCAEVLDKILDQCFIDSGLDFESYVKNEKEEVEIKQEPQEENELVVVKEDPDAQKAFKEEFKEEREDILIVDVGADSLQISSDPHDALSEQKQTDSEKVEEKAMEEKQKKEREDCQTSNNKVLWVTNITRNMRAADLKQLFSKYGKVIGAKIVSDGSICYGYISMDNTADAEKCLKKLNNYEIDGMKIGVAKLKPGSRSGSRNPEVLESAKAYDKRKSEEKREMDRLMAKRRKLDEEERMLRAERIRVEKNEFRNKEAQKKLYDERQKLRVAKEIFEKEKYEHMIAEKERKRIDQQNLDKEKMELEKLKKDLKKLRSELEEKERAFKSSTRHGSSSSSSHHSHVSGKSYHEQATRRNDDFEKPKSYERAKMGKVLEYDRGSYPAPKKEDRAASFGSKHSSLMVSTGPSSKNYPPVSKANWGDHSWRIAPMAPAPPRISWNNPNRGSNSSGGYGPGGSYSGGSYSGISCPSPPGLSYGNKFDGSGYSHNGRKY